MCAEGVVRLESLFATYPSERRGVGPISLTVAAGDVMWIQGPNGAGKTTLLRALAQLLPYRGQIWYERLLLTPETRARWLRDVAYVPGEPYLFDYLTVEENVRYLYAILGTPPPFPQDAFRHLLGELQLAEPDALVRELSTGMRQKVYWIAMLLRKSRIWLVDEAFASLDRNGAACIVENLRALIALRRGIALVTGHADQGFQPLVTRSLELRDGKERG